MRLVLPLILSAGLASAQEAIVADGPLPDDEFYRLVACAAAPGGPCRKDIVAWSPADAQDVSVGIVQIADTYPESLLKRVNIALDRAIAEVNAAHANLHLTRSDLSSIPDVGIHLLDIVEGQEIVGTGLDPLDGSILQVAQARVWWRADFSLINAAIVFGTDLGRDKNPNALASVMLEEVTQSMGLLTDVEGRYYETRSVFSETSNELTRLGQQDVMALRRHYP